ncbi:MAG: exodeoxyribonuclease VII large subunit [Clostridia bacterium]|nr:exodeoxyribonuclease VII large subunit [Clostridia bacterium]
MVLTVSQLNTYLRAVIEEDDHLSSVFVCGEISNFTNHIRSGHWYFSLKDENSILKAVMFRTANQRLRFRPESGMRVIVRGRIGVFERDGVYQLYAEDMQPDGTGALALAFEQLRRRLEAEGLFRAERKKTLPPFPATIGVITSPTGAARRDIENVLGRRFPAANILFAPVLVQGENAPEQLAAAVARMNRDGRADVIIIGRGGGSAEELWAFNDERVVRAVAASEIPVISAVGHETDVTLCDFAADRRAPTPSAAAELAVPEMRTLQAQFISFRSRMKSAAVHLLEARTRELALLAARPVLKSPEGMLNVAEQRLDDVVERLNRAGNRLVDGQTQRLAQLAGKLHALSPLQVLSRGYAAVRKDGEWLSDGGDLQPGDGVTIRFCDGEADCTVTRVRSMEE